MERSLLQQIFSAGSRSGKAYMKKLGFKYEPWMKIQEQNKDRNATCICGSGKKVKNCCGVKTKYTLK